MSTQLKKSIQCKQSDRRRFLRSAALLLGISATSLATLIPISSRFATAHLRPPGALPEDEYLASCIKCGQCVQACPVQAIKLADLQEGMGMGAPYIDARMQACDFSCGAVQCVLACPTNSLNREITVKEKVRMGLARLANSSACLAVQGLGFKGLARGVDFKGKLNYPIGNGYQITWVKDHPYDLELCDLCVRQCPIDNAISLQTIDESGKKIPVIHQACVGCGVCEMICPVEPIAIVVDIRKTWEDLA